MNDEIPEAFEDGEFGSAPGVMVGGPLDGQRYRMLLLPSHEIPDEVGFPLHQPAETSPLAVHRLIDTGAIDGVHGYLFNELQGPHGQTIDAAPKSHNLTLSPSGRLVSNGHIQTLAPGEVFVFGSNRHGRHGSGAAGAALARFGAVYGQGRGLQGRSYAIITMTWPAFLAREVDEFCRYAARHPEITFLVAEIGCNKAGYTPAQVGPLFAGAPVNVALPVSFAAVLDNSMAAEDTAEPYVPGSPRP